jgi:hypothetical protein
MNHIDKNKAILYAYDLLEKKDMNEIHKHIEECPECFAFIAGLMHEKIEACKRMRSLFGKAYNDTLDKEDIPFWNAHIKYCDSCFSEYGEYIRKREEGIFKRFMGYIEDFASSLTMMPSPSLLEASTKIDAHDFTGIKGMIHLSKKPYDLTFIVDEKGDIKAYLKSDRPPISEVTIPWQKGPKRIRESKISKDRQQRHSRSGRIDSLPSLGAKRVCSNNL